MSEIRAVLPLVVIIILIVAIPILQIYLSKRKSKWPGLILPTIFITLSILSVISVLGLTFYEGKSVSQNIIKCITVFILYNIPTIVLLGTYFPYRQDLKKKKGLEKQI